MPSTFLDGVRSSLVELELMGFMGLQFIEAKAFRNLRNINCIYIYGAEGLYPQDLKNVFDDLLYSPLDNFFMVKNPPLPRIGHLKAHVENSHWDLSQIFSSPNTNITRFSIHEAYISSFKERLSKHLPSLEFLELSLNVATLDGAIALIDALTFMPNLSTLYIYTLNTLVKDTPIYELIFSFNFRELVDAFDGSSTLLDFLKFEPKKKNFFRNTSIRLSPKLTSLSVSGVSFDFPNALMSDLKDSIVKLPPVIQYCTDDSNNLERLNFMNSYCPTGEYKWMMTGATRLRQLFLRNCNLDILFPDQFYALPQLDELLLANNPLRDFIASDSKAVTFRGCRNLKVLELSTCNLEYIPVEFFTYLPSLKLLHLKYNAIQNPDFVLRNCTQLIFIDLSFNRVEALSNYAMDEFDALAALHRLNGLLGNLVVDLTMNPLSCLCANLKFVRWIQSTSKLVSFVNLNDYTCLYPDGTQQQLITVDTSLLDHRCQIMHTLRNEPDCSCDYQELVDLHAICFSLDQYYCRYPDGKLVPIATLDPNATVSFCEKAISKLSLRTILPPTVILPVVVCIGVIVLALVMYKRKRPAQFEQMLQCLPLHQLTGALMAIVFHRNPQTEPKPEYSAFVAYPPEDRENILEDFIPTLSNAEITIMTEDDIPFGAPRIESLTESFARSRAIVLVLAPTFLADDWCREMTRMTLASQKLIVPVVYRPLPPNVDEDLLFGNALITCRPLYWSETEALVQYDVFNELRVKLTRDLRTQIKFELAE